jgi:hypothetical protein
MMVQDDRREYDVETHEPMSYLRQTHTEFIHLWQQKHQQATSKSRLQKKDDVQEYAPHPSPRL